MKKPAMMFSLLMLITLPVLTQTQSTVFNVLDFGAKGDGVTLNTGPIQKAIDRCSERGGVVFVPAGKYLTGSLEFKSNVELYLQRGATIVGSTRLTDYVEHRPRLRSYNDAFLQYSLLYAEGKTNIAIRGDGVIDGQGEQFKVISKLKPERYKNRPYLIRFVECKGVTIENVSFQRPSCWTQHYLACENLIIRGIRVYSHANKNNDMMDIDGCKNVVISDCIGDTDDDAITLKSTSKHVTENITITNCVLSSHCNALKTGTESTGGFRNIVISNIIIKPSAADSVITGKRGGIAGIALTNVDGGIMDGISISNVVIDGPEVPIFIRLGNRGRVHYEGAPAPPVGTTKNIMISDVVAKNAKTTGCSITGIPNHPVENVSLSNIRISFSGGIMARPDASPKELEDQYPESTMWGLLPAYGFFVRHVMGLNMSNIDLVYERGDVRPALVLNDVADVKVSGFAAMVSLLAEAVIGLERVNTMLITGSNVKTPTLNFIGLTGEENAGITIIGNDLSRVKNLCNLPGKNEAVIHSSSNRIR